MTTTERQKIALDLNPAEQVLMHRFRDACSLEDSMGNIRQKYADAWEMLLKCTHPELNFRILRANDSQGGRIGCGRISWPSQYSAWPSGFFVEHISFESLCAYDETRPWASIWIAPPKKLRIDLETSRKRIREKAEDSLGRPLEEGKRSVSEISMWYFLPETGQELISALTTNGGREFFAIMERHLNFFRPLIPLVDAIFRKARKW
jgi:hypothetical protein